MCDIRAVASAVRRRRLALADGDRIEKSSSCVSGTTGFLVDMRDPPPSFKIDVKATVDNSDIAKVTKKATEGAIVH